jgi:hypothetical protein
MSLYYLYSMQALEHAIADAAPASLTSTTLNWAVEKEANAPFAAHAHMSHEQRRDSYIVLVNVPFRSSTLYLSSAGDSTRNSPGCSASAARLTSLMTDDARPRYSSVCVHVGRWCAEQTSTFFGAAIILGSSCTHF